MADLSALEELLLSGYDVSALLAGAPGNAGAGLGVLALEAQLKNAGLPQPGLGWPSAGANDQTALYQEVAQSLAAKLEEHRMQQVQVATALQQLQALQQQQELAQLQQQINALHQPMRANPFQRSRTTDLECMGRSPAFDVPGPYGPALDYEQRQQLAALQSVAHPGTSPSLGLQQRVPGVISQHNLPVRSFSSEHLVAGQRRVVPPHLAGVQPAPNGVQASTKRPPVRQPSGLGPNGRGNNQGARANDGGRRARYAATAKAPSWASEDWHPMKAVIASGAHASGGTGVFLPHLAGSAPDSNGKSSCSGTASSSVPSAGSTAPGASPTLPARCISDSPAPAALAPAPVLSLVTASGHAHPHVASAVGLQPLHAHAHPHAHGQMALAAAPHAAAAAAAVAGLHSPLSPRDGSPSCSVDSNAAADPYSRGTTHEFSRASTGGFVELDVSHVPHPGAHSHPASSMGYLTADPMKVVVEEPEREKEDTAEECDFASLARELAELMSKQAVVE